MFVCFLPALMLWKSARALRSRCAVRPSLDMDHLEGGGVTETVTCRYLFIPPSERSSDFYCWKNIGQI